MLENGGVGLSDEKCQDILDRLATLEAPVHYQAEAEYSCDLPVNRDGLVTLPKKILDELHIITTRQAPMWCLPCVFLL